MKNNEPYQSDIELLTAILKHLKAIEKKLPDGSKPPAPDFEYIDNYDLLKLLKISNRTARMWRKNGVLRFAKIEGRIYYKLSDITAMMQEKFTRR